MTSIRINKYDNLKGIGIFLIVLSHILVIIEIPSANFIYKFITIIHLPIFFFVSGYFSKIGPSEPYKAFKRLLVPYIIFNLMFYASLILLKLPTQTLFIYPTFALWFLIALFMMKLSLPFISKIRFPVLTSFLLALIIGFIDIPYDLLGITRFFAYLPIFLIGFYFKDIKTYFEKNYSKIITFLNKKICLIGCGLLLIICCTIIAIIFPAQILGVADPYIQKFDFIKRVIVLILGILFTLFLNKVCTNNKSFLTKMGKNSYAIYILHVYPVSLINSYFMRPLLPNNDLFLVFSFISAIIIVYILSRDFVTKIFNKFIEVICKIILSE